MTMKKRWTAMLMAMALGLSLTACGDSGEADSGAQPGGDNANVSAEGGQALTVWAWDKAFNIYAIEEAAKIYQKENPDFQINVVEVSWNDMQPQLATILSAGNTEELPDILLMQDFAFQKYVKTYENLFTDLTDSGIDFEQFSKGKAGASTVDGRHYGIPFDNGTEVAAYRTDILEQAGYTIDDLTDIDWNRFIEIGKDVKEKTGYSLFSTQAGSSDILMQMVQSAGGSIWNEDGTPYFVGNKTLEAAVNTYKELFETGVMETANSWDEYVATFTSGKSLGAINGCWIMASIESAEDQSGLWAITNMPSLPGVDGATNYSNQGGSTWGITTNCKDTELAVDFMNKTFAGSMELYETILPGAGVLSTWIPAGESEAYAQPKEFYANQPVYEKITEFASKTPVFNTGMYFTEANDALAVAATNICSGNAIEDELKNAEETVKFNIGM